MKRFFFAAALCGNRKDGALCFTSHCADLPSGSLYLFIATCASHDRMPQCSRAIPQPLLWSFLNSNSSPRVNLFYRRNDVAVLCCSKCLVINHFISLFSHPEENSRLLNFSSDNRGKWGVTHSLTQTERYLHLSQYCHFFCQACQPYQPRASNMSWPPLATLPKHRNHNL